MKQTRARQFERQLRTIVPSPIPSRHGLSDNRDFLSIKKKKKEKKRKRKEMKSWRSVPGVTKSTIPRSRVLVATSAIHRISLRHQRNRCLFPLTPSSFSAALIGLATESRSFPITPDPPFEHLEPFSCPFPSFACRLHGREPVHVGWPEARAACKSTLPEKRIYPALERFRCSLYVLEIDSSELDRSRTELEILPVECSFTNDPILRSAWSSLLRVRSIAEK